MRSVIIRPLMTEKTLTRAGRGWYTFMARKDATKQDVAREVSNLYKVNVTQIRTAVMHGKMRRVGKAMKHIQKPDWKKAIVRLAKGQKIDVFDVTGAPEGGKKSEVRSVK